MSRLTTSPATPVLTAIMLLIAASLLLPAVGQAQSSITREQALLNFPAVTQAAAAMGHVAAVGVTDGERALLGKSPAGATGSVAVASLPSPDPRPIDGERALLAAQKSE